MSRSMDGSLSGNDYLWLTKKWSMNVNEVRMEIIQDLNKVNDISLLKTIRDMLHYGLENDFNVDKPESINYPSLLTSELEQILDERMEYHRLNPTEGSSWEEVKARMKGKT